MNELFGFLLMFTGSLFCLAGCVGLVRYQDFFLRLQVLSKSIGMGAALIMLSVFVRQGFTGMGVRALLCAICLWITLPVISYALAKATMQNKNKVG